MGLLTKNENVLIMYRANFALTQGAKLVFSEFVAQRQGEIMISIALIRDHPGSFTYGYGKKILSRSEF